MTVRHIQPQDQLQLANIIRSVFEEYGAPLVNTVYDDPRTEHVFDTLAGKNAGYWVAADNGIVLGGCGYYPTEGLPEGYAELVKFYLSPAARGFGYGSKLFLQAIEGARKAGYSHLYIESFPQFSDAVSMYERHGFRHIPHRLGDSGHTATTIFMVKDLHPIKIVQYQPKYKQDFIRLNREWIERFARIEPSDEKTFAHVDDIVANGGQIFLAIDEENEVVGCCALVSHPEKQCHELAKMAVTPKAQGRGIGRMLGESLVDYARKHGVRRIYLEGNTRLEASIALYRKLGFHEIPLQGNVYERCDILMLFDLDS